MPPRCGERLLQTHGHEPRDRHPGPFAGSGYVPTADRWPHARSMTSCTYRHVVLTPRHPRQSRVEPKERSCADTPVRIEPATPGLIHRPLDPTTCEARRSRAAPYAAWIGTVGPSGPPPTVDCSRAPGAAVERESSSLWITGQLWIAWVISTIPVRSRASACPRHPAPGTRHPAPGTRHAVPARPARTSPLIPGTTRRTGAARVRTRAPPPCAPPR